MPRFDLVTRDELAAMLRVKPYTIYLWEKDKGLPVVLYAGRKLYDIVQIEKWFAARYEQ